MSKSLPIHPVSIFLFRYMLRKRNSQRTALIFYVCPNFPIKNILREVGKVVVLVVAWPRYIEIMLFHPATLLSVLFPLGSSGRRQRYPLFGMGS